MGFLFSLRQNDAYDHVSINIETLALGKDATITEIALVLFDKNKIGRMHKWEIDWSTQDRKIDGCLLYGKLKDEVQLFRLKNSTVRCSLKDALFEICNIITDKTYVWADHFVQLQVLEDAYAQFGKPCPWSNKNRRDIRTLRHIRERDLKIVDDSILDIALSNAKLTQRLLTCGVTC